MLRKIIKPAGPLFEAEEQEVKLNLSQIFPELNEPVDAGEVYAYAERGEPLFAALALLSFIPALGEHFGEEGKISTWTYEVFPRGAAFTDGHGPKAAARINAAKDAINNHRDQVLSVGRAAGNNRLLAKYLPQMEKALADFMSREDVADASV